MTTAKLIAELHRAFKHSESSIYKKVGDRVRIARVRRGLTQAQLAAMVGLSRTSITNIERGQQRLLLHTVANLAAALAIRLDNLVG